MLVRAPKKEGKGVVAVGTSKGVVEGKGAGEGGKIETRSATGTGTGTSREREPSPTVGAPEAERERKLERLEDAVVLEPMARNPALLAPIAPLAVEVVGANAEASLRGRSLEELLPALVKRIAWAGDRHRGTVRLELGAGSHAGTTVIVHADGGRVRVEIGGAPEPELERLRARLDRRLRAHGLDVESVT